MRIICRGYGCLLLVVPVVLLFACGKKGPPLAPLVTVPAPVTELEVQRQGNEVQVGFILPVRNQDNTEPADLVRMEVYAMTTQPRMPPDRALELEEFMDAATLLETIEVVPVIPAPAVELPEPGSLPPGSSPPDGPVSQGAAVTVSEVLTLETQVAVDPWEDEREEEEEDELTKPVDSPLMNVLPIPLQREYVVVSVTSQGTETEAPTRIAVPLGLRAPEPPPAPIVEYTATVIDVTWEPPPGVRETVQLIAPPSVAPPGASGSATSIPGADGSPPTDTLVATGAIPTPSVEPPSTTPSVGIATTGEVTPPPSELPSSVPSAVDPPTVVQPEISPATSARLPLAAVGAPAGVAPTDTQTPSLVDRGTRPPTSAELAVELAGGATGNRRALPTNADSTIPPAPRRSDQSFSPSLTTAIVVGGDTGALVTGGQTPSTAPVAFKPVLQSTPVVEWPPASTYEVFEFALPEPPTDMMLEPLHAQPLTLLAVTDRRVEFGVDRCYAVRTLDVLAGFEVRSRLSPVTCITLVDTFAPVAPPGLSAVGSEGEVSLFWEPNTEEDLVGYVVLRGLLTDETLQPLTITPVAANTFRDLTAEPGVQYAYAVRAVDSAVTPNLSPVSSRVEESAR